MGHETASERNLSAFVRTMRTTASAPPLACLPYIPNKLAGPGGVRPAVAPRLKPPENGDTK